MPPQVEVTAATADDAKRARGLLEIHLKNQEFLARTEKRMMKVQGDITAVQVGEWTRLHSFLLSQR
jgi:hypothetical protein